MRIPIAQILTNQRARSGSCQTLPIAQKIYSSSELGLIEGNGSEENKLVICRIDETMGIPLSDFFFGFLLFHSSTSPLHSEYLELLADLVTANMNPNASAARRKKITKTAHVEASIKLIQRCLN